MNCNITTSRIPLQATLVEEMKKISFCSICKKTYKNAKTLASHRYNFHRAEKQITNSGDGKVLPSESTFGSVSTSRRDIKRKRYPSSQDFSNESTDTEDMEKSKLMNKKLSKKRPMSMEETSDNSEVEINRGYKRMRSSEGTSTDSNLSTEEDCDEYINRVRLETRKKLRKWKKKRIARKLEKQNMEKKKESIPKLGNSESED